MLASEDSLNMGQYFIIANLDKKEYIDPRKFTAGAKLWEICVNTTAGVLPFLLRKSNDIGSGGDIKKNYKNAGRWAGDRIAVIGDHDTTGLFLKVELHFREISEEVMAEFWDFVEEKYLGPREWEAIPL